MSLVFTDQRGGTVAVDYLDPQKQGNPQAQVRCTLRMTHAELLLMLQTGAVPEQLKGSMSVIAGKMVALEQALAQAKGPKNYAEWLAQHGLGPTVAQQLATKAYPEEARQPGDITGPGFKPPPGLRRRGTLKTVDIPASEWTDKDPDGGA